VIVTGLSRTIGIAVTGFLLAAGPATAGDQRTRPGSTAGDSGERAVPRETSTPAPRESTPAPPESSPPPRESTPAPRDSTPAPDTTTRLRDAEAPRSDRRAKPKEVKRDNPGDAHETPEWSRPRGDRPATDIAVTRTGPRPPRDSDERNDKRDCPGCSYHGPAYVPYYDAFAYYECGYGLGYDVYPGSYYSSYSPFGFGYGVPYGYAPCGGLYEGGGSPPSAPRTHGGDKQGALKLKVKPRNAKVYVDGFYVGLVDQFDGASQKLTLNQGRHTVEIKAEGFETALLDVEVTAEETVTFAGKMIQLKKNQ